MRLEDLIKDFINKEGFDNTRMVFENLHDEIKNANSKYLNLSFLCFFIATGYIYILFNFTDIDILNLDFKSNIVTLVDSSLTVFVFYGCFIFNLLRYNKAHRLLILLEAYDEDIFDILSKERNREQKIEKLVFIVKVFARTISESLTIPPLTFLIMLFTNNGKSLNTILKI